MSEMIARRGSARLLLAMLWASALFLCWSGAARAEDESTVRSEYARRQYLAGAQAYDKGDFERALVAFESAAAINPSPELDYNVAVCLDRLGRYPAAIARYERYIGARGQAAGIEEARTRVAELRAKLEPPLPLVLEKESPRRGRGRGPIAAATFCALSLGAFATAGGLLGHVGARFDACSEAKERGMGCSNGEIDGLSRSSTGGYVALGLAIGLAVTDLALWGVYAVRVKRPRTPR